MCPCLPVLEGGVGCGVGTTFFPCTPTHIHTYMPPPPQPTPVARYMVLTKFRELLDEDEHRARVLLNSRPDLGQALLQIQKLLYMMKTPPPSDRDRVDRDGGRDPRDLRDGGRDPRDRDPRDRRVGGDRDYYGGGGAGGGGALLSTPALPGLGHPLHGGPMAPPPPGPMEPRFDHGPGGPVFDPYAPPPMDPHRGPDLWGPYPPPPVDVREPAPLDPRLGDPRLGGAPPGRPGVVMDPRLAGGGGGGGPIMDPRLGGPPPPPGPLDPLLGFEALPRPQQVELVNMAHRMPEHELAMLPGEQRDKVCGVCVCDCGPVGAVSCAWPSPPVSPAGPMSLNCSGSALVLCVCVCVCVCRC